MKSWRLWGIAKFDDLVGRTELLKVLDGITAKQNRLRFVAVASAA